MTVYGDFLYYGRFDFIIWFSFYKNVDSSPKGDGGAETAWERDNRVPQDNETVLKNGEYKATNKRVKGAKVYEKDGKYYHRDTLHKGKASHLEVYNKRGNHLGEADPKTGILKPGTADPTKTLPQ